MPCIARKGTSSGARVVCFQPSLAESSMARAVTRIFDNKYPKYLFFAPALRFTTATQLLRCRDCGSLNAETNLKCGLCGSTSLGSLTTTPPPQSAKPPPLQSNSRKKALAVLVVGVAALIDGAALIFLQISPALTAIGFFVLMFGAVVVLLPLVVFNNTPYRSRLLNNFERRQRARERKQVGD